MAKNKKKSKKKQNADLDYERKYMIGSAMSFASSESIKLLRTNLTFSFSDGEQCHIVGVTSSVKGEGKSIVSMNLAYSFALAKKKVLLVEGDMRLPTMGDRLGIKKAPGLSNLLVNRGMVYSAIRQQLVVSLEDGEAINLDVITSGDIPPNPSELLGSERFKSLLTLLREHYDYIIVDLPPVNLVADGLIVSSITDGMILVVRDGFTDRGAVNEAVRQLKFVNAKILGFVYNGVNERAGYYKKYSKGYYGKGSRYGGYESTRPTAIPRVDPPEGSGKKKKKK